MRIRNARDRSGFSLIELLIVVAIIMVLAAIAIPLFNQTLNYSRESAAVKQIGTIHAAQTQFYAQFGRFAGQMSELGPPSTGRSGPNGANLISKEFALGKRSGYVFQIQPTPSGYSVNAAPEVHNGTGRRTFYSDETGIIHENWGPEPATAVSPEFR